VTTKLATIPDIDAIMAYEDGTLGQEETLALFQQLVDSGMAWRLQGSYGRTAHMLLQEGLIHPAQNA
jgi:hypothetical protein